VIDILKSLLIILFSSSLRTIQKFTTAKWRTAIKEEWVRLFIRYTILGDFLRYNKIITCQIYTKKKVKHPHVFFEMTNDPTSITTLLTG
jgi:hypothetical protein